MIPSQPTHTITLTDLVIIITDPAGHAYTTLSTMLPAPAPTNAVVLVSDQAHSGWNSWNDAQKGGLLAGCILIFLMMVGVAVILLMRRNNVWLSRDPGSGSPVMMPPVGTTMVPCQPVQYTYAQGQGYWPSWGVRGGGKEVWWKKSFHSLQSRR